MIKDEDVAAKKEFIVIFFDVFENKIENVKKMLAQGFTEESLLLSCCYIGALANFRYERSDDRDNFIKIIYDYSNQKDLFSKISWINFYRKGKDLTEKGSKGKAISNYSAIKMALLKKYDKKCDHQQEMDKEGISEYLQSALGVLDYKNLETNLDKFSYAAVLYEEYRCAGVHEGSLTVTWDAKTGKPLFEKREDGADIYYSGNTLCFSKEIIIGTLESIHSNLRRKCIMEIKWPYELGCSINSILDELS